MNQQPTLTNTPDYDGGIVDLYVKANQHITRGMFELDDSYQDAFFFKLLDTEFRFASLHHLFSCIRDTISDTSYGKNLPIRNSVRYETKRSPRIPCIQDVERQTILVDPLIAYRNPVIDLYAGKTISIYCYPAEERFFAPLRKHIAKNDTVLRNTEHSEAATKAACAHESADVIPDLG